MVPMLAWAAPVKEGNQVVSIFEMFHVLIVELKHLGTLPERYHALTLHQVIRDMQCFKEMLESYMVDAPFLYSH